MKKLLDVRDLCFAYYKNPLCINNATFVVDENQKVLLLGVKDMGKTTLLKAVSSFDDTYMGQVLYKGKDLKKYCDEDKNFSLLLSEPVLINSTIKDNIDFLCETIKKEKLSEFELNELLKEFKICHDLNTKIKNLSLIEKRKLSLARTFIKNANILFFDDLLEGLNNEDSNEIIELLKKFLAQRKTIIMASEDDSMKNNKEFFEIIKFDKIIYISFSKTYEYKSLKEFFEKKINFDVLSFSDDYQYSKAWILRDNGAYYLVDENNDARLKFDKAFYDKLTMLSLIDDENEEVFVCFEKDKPFSIDNDYEFNLRLKLGNLWVYSAIDKSRII